VVAVARSAGGLDALSRIVRRLPSDFAAAVIVLRHRSPPSFSAIVLRHRDPNGHDELASVLAGRTSLAVKSAHDGDPLVAGQIVVAPVGYHTLVTGDGRISLIASGERPPYRPSADLLLTTLALAAGPRAIAVVLSGYGNDAATGATAIHHHGGVVIVSDEATSTVFDMPSATINRHEIIDHVLGVDEITAILGQLVYTLDRRAELDGRTGGGQLSTDRAPAPN
jgi:two-component system chemotaxis response regulator CheB